ncbi:MAG TPA: preprotein translocase subunit SecA, partial [Planctomycetota bacterium]|nr:preprotein translocase subunit SecA [Planctomycetota bacterium]
MALGTVLKAVFGDRNERVLKTLRPLVEQVNALEGKYQALDAAALAGTTAALRQRLDAGESLDDLLPDAFAAAREAARRTLGQRPFDVQILGGIVLHNGNIAEMATGEGKTLTAVAPAYLNALLRKGVFIVTVNDYLAQRDRDWMHPVYAALGMTTGAIQSNMSPTERQVQYACDVTFGTNNEFGFDYLRDNMKSRREDQVQKHLEYAIIDEVDSILIDEARTPLIISGLPESSTQRYYEADRVARELKAGPDFEVKEKEHMCVLTEEGIEHAQRLAGVESFYDGEHMDWPHHLEQALRAHYIYKLDKEYVVHQGEQGPEIVIVDEFTGRLMPGRRWSDGLHQAVEAKEGTTIKNESQTLASITFQNYFRLYKKLSGMTGTADTEAFEFSTIYNLETVLIPTHRPMVRKDLNDQVFITAKEKQQAIINDVKERTGKGQPILVGTTSVEASELLSGLLEREKIPHNVLNAKQHAREAEIVAQAGRPGVITIATNMAGRGTDIVLGGNVEKQVQFIEADDAIPADEKARRIQQLHDEWQGLHDAVKTQGGLRIIATERHESRRIDNQLRGRSGRQGDPGSSRFYLSLDDSLMRIFAGDRVRAIMDRLKMPDGEAIEAGIVTRSIEGAQRKVEARNFDIRKQL